MIANVFAAVLLAAAMTPAQQAHQLVGTYACVDHGKFPNGDTVERFTNVADTFGPWVHLHSTFPPQHGQDILFANTYLGYDPQTKRWNIVAVETDGSHFTRTSTSTNLNGARWTDVDPPDGDTAVLSWQTPSQWKFDVVTAKGDQYHVVCTRQ